MTLSTGRIYGMMIAKVHNAYREATSKRAAWVLGFRGIPTFFSHSLITMNAVYLCIIFTAKIKVMLQDANSLKHVHHCHSPESGNPFCDSIIMTKIKTNFVFVTFILVLLSFGITESFAYEQFIRLAWSANTEPHLSHYNLYRDTKSGTMVYLATINSSDSIYTDFEIVPGSNYYYKLTAVDDQGFESAPSDEVLAMTKAIPDPERTNGNNTVLEQFELKQNYPNPFNPSTMIDYRVPEYTNVIITVFNVLGKEVRILVNDYKEAGNYQVEWDGRDNGGSHVSTGVYFYQMSTINFKAAKKLNLQK